MGPLVLASQLATGLAVIAGAALIKSAVDSAARPMAGGWNRCATCNGTGRTACMCSRWSDGDVGCRACAGSGRMACRTCGGSGTGRPIPVRLVVQPKPPPPQV